MLPLQKSVDLLLRQVEAGDLDQLLSLLLHLQLVAVLVELQEAISRSVGFSRRDVERSSNGHAPGSLACAAS